MVSTQSMAYTFLGHFESIHKAMTIALIVELVKPILMGTSLNNQAPIKYLLEQFTKVMRTLSTSYTLLLYSK